MKTYGYVDADYLAAAGELFAPIKYRSYELLGDIVGRRLLDIGCGPGFDTVAMAKLAGEHGFINGIDIDDEMIKLAQQRTARQGLAQRVTHQKADVCDLPFADHYFDGVRSERLFMHLAQPALALAEAVRVTRRGGGVVLVDTDWGSLSTNTECPDIEQRLRCFRAERFLPNGYSGRRLRGLMNNCGLRNIVLETFAVHVTELAFWRFLTQSDAVEKAALERQVLNGDELERWHSALNAVATRHAFFGSVTVVIASARK